MSNASASDPSDNKPRRVPIGPLAAALASKVEAASLLFIASDEASYVSGAEFLVDGAMIC